MLRPGMYISDRYEIIEKIGSGGMSDVYKALCHKLNRYVAIKVLKDEYSDDKNFVTKFRVEAQSVAGLSHGNIVNIYDVGDDGGVYYIVMELVEGITLKEYINRKGKLSIEDTVNIAIQVALGIEIAHKNHIIHRDIKPQNIIISKDGVAKVTDFGIAKAATSNTIASSAMGSVHYISPEQARGGYSDEKSDIYSLGITMYEMVTGEVPFDGDNNVSVALLHIQGSLTLPSDIRPDLPGSLESIILKCTQKKSERRYLVIGDLIKDLKTVLSNPNGNFVKVAPILDDSPTVFMTPDEMKYIKDESSKNQIQEDDEYEYEYEYEYEDDGFKNDGLEDEVTIPHKKDNSESKVEKLIAGLGIAAGIMLLAIIIFIAVKLLGGSGSGEKGIEDIPKTTEGAITTSDNKVIMIGVVNTKYTSATAELNELGLKVEATHEHSDKFEEGYVISQDIESGAEVNVGTTVNLIVSLGPENSNELPSVVGMNEDDAYKLLHDTLGLDVKREYQNSDTVANGLVVKQTPDKGTIYKKGDTITIIISKGKDVKEAEIPYLSGMTEAQARAALESRGFVVGDISHAYHDTMEKGKVIGQSVKAGVVRSEGTIVDFTISWGKQQYEATIVVDNPFSEDDTEGTLQVNLINEATGEVISEKKYVFSSAEKFGPSQEYKFQSDGKFNAVVKIYFNGTLILEKRVQFVAVD